MCHEAPGHTYKLDFVVPLNSRQSVLAVDETSAETKEYIKHYGALWESKKAILCRHTEKIYKVR